MAMGAGACKASLLMVLFELGLAVFIVLQSSLLASGDTSATVLVVYVHIVSSAVLSSLAFFLERERRPRITVRIACWAFFLGFLQFTLSQLLETWSLRYVTASFQSSLLNTESAVVFVLAVAAGRERFGFCGARGQAKLWGTLLSAAGAIAVVLSTKNDEAAAAPGGVSAWFVGFLLVALAVLASALFKLLVERVAARFSADLTLSAMMAVSGTLQLAAVAAVTERNPSAWRIRWNGSHLLLVVILYGGIVVSGIFYYATNWCIHTKGPLFVAAFTPLLIVFTFLLEMLFLGAHAHAWSVMGAVLVVGGLYLLLWAKAEDYKAEADAAPVERSNREPLLLDKA
ncbi:hypothetical protein Taro_007779 [Colocasia esculenta]|uniref:WAT1-related protein n=1 Tax=Colocasia esculenta TaxID=4460 RepID=A0A843TZ78_COLES|nr:hypothetical protein [Colocasia esculenta]